MVPKLDHKAVSAAMVEVPRIYLRPIFMLAPESLQVAEEFARSRQWIRHLRTSHKHSISVGIESQGHCKSELRTPFRHVGATNPVTDGPRQVDTVLKTSFRAYGVSLTVLSADEIGSSMRASAFASSSAGIEDVVR